MPKIEDIHEAKRKFKKSNYRPWNFLDELEKESIENDLAENQSENKVEPNLSRSGVKVEPNLSQSGVKVESNLSQEKPKLRTELRPKVEPNLSQSGVKVEPKQLFTTLTGLQRKLTLFIHEVCQKNLSHETPPLSIDLIKNHCESTSSAVRKAIQRLEKKQVIIRSCFKDGRGGWTQYQLPDQMYQEVNQYKLEPNLSQSGAKVRTELGTELEPSCSSSSYINNKTTTTGSVVVPFNSELPPEWAIIDLAPLSDIGFTKTHLLQIIQQNKLSSEMVQDSIFAFAFDLERNNKTASIKGSPLNYFMGVVRNGVPYAFPENYESPQQEALRKYYERKKISELKQAELEKDLMDSEFGHWLSSLKEEEINDFVPSAFRKMDVNGQPKQAALKEHFRKNIWPQVKNKLQVL